MMTDILFGIRCFLIMKDGLAPMLRLARTYSCCFKLRTCPRTNRAMPTQYRRAKTIKMESMLVPKVETKALLAKSLLFLKIICKTEDKRMMIITSGTL